MMANAEELELKDRLNLIENMIAEGRRTTESWGWTFVLWGLAYYVAIAWGTFGHSNLAWPVTMIATGVLTGILSSRSARHRPETTIGRAMLAIWLGMGISIFALMLSLGASGRLDVHVSAAIVGAMLGTAVLFLAAIFFCQIVFGIYGMICESRKRSQGVSHA
jgi:Kef-type K+ transport system membrane component KefB